MTTDAYYTAPVSLAAQLRSEAGSMVFMYVNEYNFSTGALNIHENFLPRWMGKFYFLTALFEKKNVSFFPENGKIFV